ncbi:thioesterase family protein [Vitiosangium sp. GDMCC 1.1324]|uniref:acyl-CoA thioesterase n=1 Tax=Vitiosangium sp. (strain GDMCC 1.1324) TaxID=2138576 RepID=UPI000D3BCC14|nr:acyl-CoA thioesterase [Vitiosangium sp. GDMCC 1.1324]PTL83657.1 acyl-CoA thioesterase [Vitiosangium sp. GDMCC 1.1324]
MVTETAIVVRSTELDPNGHVNNAKFLEYLEWGRFDWFADSGLDLNQLAPKYGVVVANVNMNYRREARRGERLRVRTWLVARGESSFRYGQDILNERGEVVVDAEVVNVGFDMVERRSAPLPEELRRRFDELIVPGKLRQVGATAARR